MAEKNDKEVVSAALPAPKAPEIDAKALEDARKLIALDAELKAKKNEADPKGWGPGKPGKKLCDLPPVPPEYGDVTVNTNEEVVAKDGTKFNRVKLVHLKGRVSLTHDEYQEALYRIDRLMRHNMEERHGRGKAKSITAFYDLSQGAWIKGSKDGKAVDPLSGIF